MIREVATRYSLQLTCDGAPCRGPHGKIKDSVDLLHASRRDEFYNEARAEGWQIDMLGLRCLCPECVLAGKKLPQ